MIENVVTLVKATHDIAYFAQEVLGLKLRPHQIDILRLANPKLNPDDVVHGMGVLPRQSGLTMSLAIIAAHTLIFQQYKTKAFLLINETLVSMFQQDVNKYLSQSAEYFGKQLKIDLHTNRHGLITSDTTRVLISTINANTLRGHTINDVFIDTPRSDKQFFDFIQYTLPALSAMKARVFAYSTGVNEGIEFIADLIDNGDNEVRYVEANPFKIFNKETLLKNLIIMGKDAFEREFLCTV